MTIDDLWRTHADELVRFATLLAGPDDANDLVAEAFLRLDATRSRVSNPRAYLFRSIRNAAVDRHRSTERRRRRELLVAERATGQLPDHDPALVAAVRALSPQQRAVVYFAYWEDLTEPAIAEALGTTVGTVRRQLGRARQRLRKVLE